MKCPCCSSSQIHRSRRRGILDSLKATLGRWPFSCEACGQRFSAPRRYVPATPIWPSPIQSEAHRAKQEAEGAAMAYKRQGERPMAKVVIQADDDVQLDKILLALHRAVSSHQHVQTSSYAN